MIGLPSVRWLPLFTGLIATIYLRVRIPAPGSWVSPHSSEQLESATQSLAFLMHFVFNHHFLPIPNSLAFSLFMSLVLIARVLMIHASCPHFHPFSKPIQNSKKMLQYRRSAAVTALPHPSTQLFRFTIILVFLGRLNGDSVCRPFRPSSFWHFSWVRSYS